MLSGRKGIADQTDLINCPAIDVTRLQLVLIEGFSMTDFDEDIVTRPRFSTALTATTGLEYSSRSGTVTAGKSVVYGLMCKFLAGLKRPWYEGDCRDQP